MINLESETPKRPQEGRHPRTRTGKTKKDKAKGHNPRAKNFKGQGERGHHNLTKGKK